MGVEGEERGTQQGFQLWYLKQALIRVALLSSDQIILETFLCFLFFFFGWRIVKRLWI
jgi:hypothetical protein